MRKWGYRLIVTLIFLLGAGMISYPILSNFSYERSQQKLMDRYDSVVHQESPDAISRHFEECDKYNNDLLDGGAVLTDPFDETQLDPDTMPYAGLLNILGDGVMGSLEFPGVTDRLAIYHGTREDSLQKGIGHLQGTSLPVGGTGTHCVLSAHSGLSGKKLFTNLDKARLGDVFYLYILDRTLAYRVDDIRVVLPSETKDLMIHAEHDYVTLITCTPYGINSHRLLVRGTRIPYEEAKKAEQGQRLRFGTWMTQYVKAIVTGLALGAALLICLRLLGKIFGKNKPDRKER